MRILLVSISVIIILLASVTSNSPSYAAAPIDKRKQVTLTALLEDQGDPDR